MSLNFIVEEINQPSYQAYEDGVYKTKIECMEKGTSLFGDYIEIHRRFMEGQYENEVWPKKYEIGHENEMVRSIATQALSRLAINVAGSKPGEELEEEKLIGKITLITIKNKLSNNGKIYTNIVKEILFEGPKQPNSNQPLPIYPLSEVGNVPF